MRWEIRVQVVDSMSPSQILAEQAPEILAQLPIKIMVRTPPLLQD
jgi:hypothetical protein